MQHLFPPSGALLPTDKNNPFQNMSPLLRNRPSLKRWKDIPRHDYGLYNEFVHPFLSLRKTVEPKIEVILLREKSGSDA
ncbi:hypothetical protein CEXT_629161 [Caerostris extrusa]|uniref:Uncharacterized protein n=1 Tax=Caerostris extrusa TaxID=172846 RepID=A0AAV4V5V2_CAEEX|nr:hypothetical protein CEXT_629161 [Caerostris extrusa]